MGPDFTSCLSNQWILSPATVIWKAVQMDMFPCLGKTFEIFARPPKGWCVTQSRPNGSHLLFPVFMQNHLGFSAFGVAHVQIYVGFTVC